MNRYKSFLIVWIITVGMGIAYVILGGCAEIPDREMDEHYMQCIVIAKGEAFCK